jgi:diguanylate cyclase (GGDEF)-like protein
VADDAAGLPRALTGMARGWRADFADPESIRRLRARLITTACVMSALAMVMVGVITGPSLAAAQAGRLVATGGYVVALGIYAARRGARMGDVAVAVVVFSGYPATAVGVLNANESGPVPMYAVGSMISTVLGVLFLERTALAIGGVAISAALVLVVARAAPPAQVNPSAVVVSTICVLFTGLSMRVMRDLAASALTRARQGEVTDALTGLGNRRGLERASHGLWDRSLADRQCVAALVVDVDHFKQINDTQGHAAGDEVLRRLGAVLSENLRAGDVAVRLGGEEFLLLCPTTPAGAELIAESVRGRVERLLHPVTVSVGVHVVRPAPQDTLPDTVWSAVEVADEALYQAKRAGRNRVAVAEPAAS